MDELSFSLPETDNLGYFQISLKKNTPHTHTHKSCANGEAPPRPHHVPEAAGKLCGAALPEM